MRAIQRQYPVIASYNVKEQERHKRGRGICRGTSTCKICSDEIAKFESLWKTYSPKMSKMAYQYCMDGIVGLEHHDLVQEAQWQLLQAIRTYGRKIEKKETLSGKNDGRRTAKTIAKFSTFYYTLVKNQFLRIKKFCTANDVIVEIKNSGGKVIEIINGENNDILDEAINRVRNKYPKEKLLVNKRINFGNKTKDKKSKRLSMHSLMSLDYEVPRGWVTGGGTGDMPRSLKDVLHGDRDVSTSSYFMEKVYSILPNERAKKIVDLILEGRALTGKGGISELLNIPENVLGMELRKIKKSLAPLMA